MIRNEYLSLINDEIKAVTAKIGELVSTNGSNEDIDLARIRLQKLFNQRKSFLYRPAPPARFIERVFSESRHEDRQRVAGELEAEVIETLLKLQKEPEDIQSQSADFKDDWLDVLSFLRFFKALRRTDPLEDQGTQTYRIKWGNRPGLTIRRFCDDLCTKKFIGFQDAKLLEAVLEDYKEVREIQPAINWQGSLDSLTTFLIIGQCLGILNPDTAPARTRVLLDDECGQDSYPVPPAASIINQCFVINGSVPDVSTVSRHHARAIILDWEIVESRLRRFYETRHLGPKTANNLTLDDVILSFPKLLNDPAVGRRMIFEDIDQLDEEVLGFYADMIADSINSRGEVADRLASAT